MNNSATQAPPRQLHAEPTHPRSLARIRAAGSETKLAVAGTTVIAVLDGIAASHAAARTARVKRGVDDNLATLS
jgi:hypothetical protein